MKIDSHAAFCREFMLNWGGGGGRVLFYLKNAGFLLSFMLLDYDFSRTCCVIHTNTYA